MVWSGTNQMLPGLERRLSLWAIKSCPTHSLQRSPAGPLLFCAVEHPASNHNNDSLSSRSVFHLDLDAPQKLQVFSESWVQFVEDSNFLLI
jgi:hypothetical protein